MSTDDNAALPKGRFEGYDSKQARLEVRSDGVVVSGDIFRLASGLETWVASFRSRSEPRLALDGSITMAVIARDRFQATCTGEVTFTPSTTDWQMSLRFSGKLDGLPVHHAIHTRLQAKGSMLRLVQLEILREAGTPALRRINLSAQGDFGIEEAFADAGIELVVHAQRNDLPARPGGGWSEKQLHTLMSDYAQSDLKRPGFSLCLLWLSKSTQSNLHGVMFDYGKQDSNKRPRQGAAVFAGAVQDSAKPSTTLGAKLLKTAVHEIGHVLNLVHPFDIHARGYESLSFMNYEHKYPGRADVFWKKFAFRFAGDELSFLHHGHFPDIIPGGSPFGSAHYWEGSASGYSTIRPETVQEDFSVELLAPISGPLFAFAQQVILGLRFTNHSGQQISVPADFLDPKTGSAEILIERESSMPAAPPLTFRPMTQRCTGASTLKQIAAGESLEDNLNLSFGAQGFSFIEPGNYRITAYLHLRTGGTSRILRSQTLRIRVLSPAGREEEHAALDIFEPSAGEVLALGGTAACENAVSRLMETANRLSFGGRGKTRVHPVATGLYRTLLFHYQQRYVRLRDGRFSLSTTQQDNAKRCADKLGNDALNCLDGVSQKATRAFLDKFRKEVR